jgi:hypothetical protein
MSIQVNLLIIYIFIRANDLIYIVDFILLIDSNYLFFNGNQISL